MKKMIASIFVCVVLLGCSDDPAPARAPAPAPSPAPAPVVKEQKVIFDVETVSCSGDSMCDGLVLMMQSKCIEMSTTLSSQMSSGWRVVTSTRKEKLATYSGPVKCVGTEYILEK